MAQDRLAEAQKPLAEVERIRTAARCREAAEFSAEIDRLRRTHEAELAAWVASGAKGARPTPATELLEAGHRLGEIAGAAGAAEAQVPIAQEDMSGRPRVSAKRRRI
jgi:hypothetical protein